ncbi:MAG: hypothetical protein JXA22_00940 [Candidatus Thermoplasmatota archaeon]|nr:hypothetical protein [Candidatus Thermoplasmatota archaeon]
MEFLDVAAASKDVLVGLLMVLSLALTVIGLLSYRRTGNPKVGMVTISFILFLLKGIFLAVGLYFTDLVRVPRGFAFSFDIMLAIDVLVLLALYLALFRKGRS